MSPVDGGGNVNPVAPSAGGGGHSGHGNGAAPTFAAAYANALSNAAPAQALAVAGHAHGASLASPTSASAMIAATHGGHGASPAGGPRFIPLTGQHQNNENHGFQEMVLGLRAYRQQLIASNIANADTPGYAAVDIDFREAVRIAQATMAAPVDLVTTHSKHLVGSGPSTPYGVPLKYHAPNQPSADGNTVDMDVERSKFAENAVMYEFSLDRVKGHYMMMQELLKNLPY